MVKNISRRQCWLALLVLLAAVVVVVAFLAFGPLQLYAKSGTPEFCGRCHVMESRYEAWFHAGGHRRIKCVDCHLPGDSTWSHALWKVIDGGKEFFLFHTGQISEEIHLSSHGAKILKDNCLRCHKETMARLNEDRNCWECHRRLRHRQTGALAILP
jgi:cytochrome c nitrite reductase small subunit|uniref:Cytochrome c nitrite reductase small subunit n=1 Tax=Desulfobacca acetoxidans TaxID=60893 RepID=A0A7C5ALE2_9BACT